MGGSESGFHYSINGLVKFWPIGLMGLRRPTLLHLKLERVVPNRRQHCQGNEQEDRPAHPRPRPLRACSGRHAPSQQVDALQPADEPGHRQCRVQEESGPHNLHGPIRHPLLAGGIRHDGPRDPVEPSSRAKSCFHDRASRVNLCGERLPGCQRIAGKDVGRAGNHRVVQMDVRDNDQPQEEVSRKARGQNLRWPREDAPARRPPEVASGPDRQAAEQRWREQRRASQKKPVGRASERRKDRQEDGEWKRRNQADCRGQPPPPKQTAP